MPPSQRIAASTNDLDDLLVDGATVYISFHLCDALGNCGLRWSYPIKIDLTPPLVPNGTVVFPTVDFSMAHLPHAAGTLFVDKSYNTSADGVARYFAFREYIRPSWNSFADDQPSRRRGASGRCAVRR